MARVNRGDKKEFVNFFADDELLIGKDFWNFVCKMDNGYEIVLDAYKERAGMIKKSLDSIKKTYLG